METIRKINNELTIAGQIDSAELKRLADEGYKSVLNLRSPDEMGFQSSEQLYAQLLGLHYTNLPIKLTEINSANTVQVFQKLLNYPNLL